MSCIHNNFNDDDNWGGCIHCSEEEKHRVYYDRNHTSTSYEPPDEPEFIPNVFHYHTKIKRNSIIFVGEQFTIINYNSVILSIPNKIIKLKGKKNKVFVHKNIFNKILIKNNLSPIP